MGNQAEYGTKGHDHGVPFVAQGLIAYRHFQVYQDYLHAMSSKDHPLSKDSDSVAQCIKPPHVGDQVPGKDCTCGFYASYSPATDFFPKQTWHQLLKITVHAVVKMRGSVVMGDTGVRAEKMTVKAVAIAWDKCVNMKDMGRLYRPATQIIEDVSKSYGAAFYESADDMHLAYPQPDISHLISEPMPVSTPVIRSAPRISNFNLKRKPRGQGQYAKWSPYYVDPNPVPGPKG